MAAPEGASPTQGGALLAYNNCDHKDVQVPQPPADWRRLDPKAYAHLLPGCAPGALRCAASPITQRMAPEDLVLLIYDSHTPYNDASVARDTSNAPATRLTAALETGFGREVWGDAVALYAAPGRDLDLQRGWGSLDNLIYGPFLGWFGEDEGPPSEEQVAEWVSAYKRGFYTHGPEDFETWSEEDGDDDEEEGEDTEGGA